MGPPNNNLYLGHWRTKWTAIEGVRAYFDKITEELIDPLRLTAATDPFLVALGRAYISYDKALLENNRVDFAHLQSIVLKLLEEPTISTAVCKSINFVLVDEYQDTNFVQEQLLLKLTSEHRNLCVVGDEDQSLYRFRGATVRNILEFPERMPGCKLIKLITNYRSHRDIVARYDQWMASANWSNPQGTPFRFDKTIVPDPNGQHPAYPAIFCIWGRDSRDEASRFADMVKFFKERNVIRTTARLLCCCIAFVRTTADHTLRPFPGWGLLGTALAHAHILRIRRSATS